ncbi:MAG: UDP-N-acetylmuramoyl-tripeptide--D-alanyl-D-alanine ligase [Bacilli bacterium]
MTIKYFIFIFIFLMDFILYFLQNLHIFQLNYYNHETQLLWIKKNKIQIINNAIFYVFSLVVMIFYKNWLFLTICFYIIMIIKHLPKKAKKPLVYTPRIKRTIMVSIILNILIILGSYIILGNYFIFIMPFISMVTPFTIILCDNILKPVHKHINKGFENKARRKIEDMKDLIIIGITGSYGKTSTKNYLYQMLSTKYNTLKTPGNINTKMGIVKHINENLKATDEVYICEMGADHTGDIKESCELVHPTYGIITTIGPQHLETFKTIDNIINTKFELADEIKVNNKGKIALNFDNEYIRNKKYDGPFISYSLENKKADIYAYDIKVDENGMSFKVKDSNGKEITFETKILGRHNIQNIVAALSISQSLGIELEKLKSVVRNLENVTHRLELKKVGNKVIIDDAYNSNPVGAKNALEVLSSFNGIKILVTPGMVELGEKEEELNKEFGKNATRVCDYIILVGKKQTLPIASAIKKTKFDLKKLFVFDTIDEALKKVDEIKPGNKQKIVLLENDLPDQY